MFDEILSICDEILFECDVILFESDVIFDGSYEILAARNVLYIIAGRIVYTLPPSPMNQSNEETNGVGEAIRLDA